MKRFVFIFLISINSLINFHCKAYSFNDATIPPNIKTVKVLTIENNASYVNPNLAPQLTTTILQNIVSKTRLYGVKGSNPADYIIKGVIVEYNPNIIAGVSAVGGSQNQLKVTLKVELINTQTDDVSQFEISRNWNYDYNQAFSSVEVSLLPEIVKAISDDLFNKIFSNW